MTVRTPLRLAALAPIALGATLLAGCGGSTPAAGGSQPASSNSNGSSSAGSNTDANSGSSGGGTSINDGIGHPVNVCSLLPASTAASLSGVPVTVAQEQDTPSYKLWVCNYTTTAVGTSGFNISVLADDAVPGYTGSLQADTSAKSVSGIGDKAFSGVLGFEALFGNVSINVSGLQSDSASEALIRYLQPKL
jgi:hypothetical protein